MTRSFYVNSGFTETRLHELPSNKTLEEHQSKRDSEYLNTCHDLQVEMCLW